MRSRFAGARATLGWSSCGMSCRECRPRRHSHREPHVSGEHATESTWNDCAPRRSRGGLSAHRLLSPTRDEHPATRAIVGATSREALAERTATSNRCGEAATCQLDRTEVSQAPLEAASRSTSLRWSPCDARQRGRADHAWRAAEFAGHRLRRWPRSGRRKPACLGRLSRASVRSRGAAKGGNSRHRWAARRRSAASRGPLRRVSIVLARAGGRSGFRTHLTSHAIPWRLACHVTRGDVHPLGER